MAQKTIMAHMKQRRDTLANWASINPVLLDGELGIVTDDPNLYKVGNGSTAWNDLPFRGFDGTLVHHTGTSATAVMSQKAVTDALRTKAEPDGKYPEMTAGFANNLVGRGEAVDAVIDFRASGGKSIEDGAARVKELRGNTIVVDGELLSCKAEGIKSVGFNAWDEEWEVGGLSQENGSLYTTSKSIRSKNFNRVLEDVEYCIKANDNIVFACVYDKDFRFLDSWSVAANATRVFTMDKGACWIKIGLPDNTTSVYAGGICINLSHTGYRNGEYQPYMQFIRDLDPRIREAFPNGLRSAGNAYDKVYNKNGKGIIEKRIGMVDLGTFNWSYGTYLGASYFHATDSYVNEEALCGRYNHDKVHNNVVDMDDKSFIVASNQVYIKDSAYSDAATFKAAMQGVLFFYAFETPEVIEYDEPFNLDYTVWDFGTEQLMSSGPSAPIRARIVYGFNAVDSVRTAQLEIAELKTQIAQMQTLMASLAAQPTAVTE